jgi:hypothetical protein
MKCPYCAGEIPEEAAQCPLCAGILDPSHPARAATPWTPPVQLPKLSQPRRRARTLSVAFILLIVGIFIFVVRMQQPIPVPTPGPSPRLPATQLWVDNGYPFEIGVEVDGGPLCRVGPHGQAKAPVAKDKHMFRVVGDKRQVLSELEETIMGGGKYLLNPGRRNSYTIHTVRYSRAVQTQPPPGPRDVGNLEWVDITHIDYVLEPPPSSVYLKPGQTVFLTSIERR